MTTVFDQCFAIVVGIEGKLSTDRSDRGNWSSGQVGVGQLIGTKYGVAAAFHPGVDIPNLTLEGAKQIHLDEYWTPARCDLLPPRPALAMYDCAINEGVSVGKKFMQRALGVSPDGVIGPDTAAAFRACKDVHLARFLALRGQRYASDPNFTIDGLGWLDRLFTLCLAPLTPPAP